MAGQPQPVGTGDGNVVAAFQRPGQRVDECVAFPDQNEDIAGLDRPLDALLDDRFLADHLLDPVGDPARENGGGRLVGRRVEGRGPVFLLLTAASGATIVPEIDGAWVTDPAGAVNCTGSPTRAEASRVLG